MKEGGECWHDICIEYFMYSRSLVCVSLSSSTPVFSSFLFPNHPLCLCFAFYWITLLLVFGKIMCCFVFDKFGLKFCCFSSGKILILYASIPNVFAIIFFACFLSFFLLSFCSVLFCSVLFGLVYFTSNSTSRRVMRVNCVNANLYSHILLLEAGEKKQFYYVVAVPCHICLFAWVYVCVYSTHYFWFGKFTCSCIVDDWWWNISQIK